MKKTIEKVIQVIEMIINACLLPLFKVKFFHEVAVFPGETETGEYITQRVDHYYSIMDNLKYDPLRLVYISIGLIVMSIIISLFALFMKNKNMKCAGHIFSVCSIAFFLFVLYTASLVERCY